MIQGLLVDFGGVLTTSFLECLRGFCRREGLPDSALVDLITTDVTGRRLLADLERGDLSQVEFSGQVACLLDVEPDGLVERVMADLRPEPLMLRAVARARAQGIRVAVVTNSWGTEPVNPYAPWRLDEIAEAVVVSEQIRVRKPDPKIYLYATGALGLEPGECVMVDDMEHNLPSAAALGMATVHHIDPIVTVAALQDLLGVSLG